MRQLYQIVFYVPENYLAVTKEAMFAAGAGKIGDYDRCCWQVLGQGQFRPNAEAQPFIGNSQQLEQLAEYRVEMVCAAEYIKEAIAALRQAHPYEEPAISCWRIEAL